MTFSTNKFQWQNKRNKGVRNRGFSKFLPWYTTLILILGRMRGWWFVWNIILTADTNNGGKHIGHFLGFSLPKILIVCKTPPIEGKSTYCELSGKRHYFVLMIFVWYLLKEHPRTCYYKIPPLISVISHLISIISPLIFTTFYFITFASNLFSFSNPKF